MTEEHKQAFRELKEWCKKYGASISHNRWSIADKCLHFNFMKRTHAHYLLENGDFNEAVTSLRSVEWHEFIDEGSK